MDRSLASQLRHHAHVDPHVRGRWLSDVILGAQDGVVNTLGVVLGVSTATESARIVLATGIAAAAAESISMAAVAYTSTAARGALFRAERAREHRHVREVPAIERKEVHDLFHGLGFRDDLLTRAVGVVCTDRDRWVNLMMREEHQLEDVDVRSSLRSAVVVGVSSLVASVLPVLPFALASGRPAMGAAGAVGLALLLVLGGTKARLTIGSPWREAVKLAAVGAVSALVAWLLAVALR